MYSKIAKYRVKNFMSIGEAEIDFTDSNIINFCGYNDSGKSALLKGLDILMYDSYSKLQKGFIKMGKTQFMLEVEFDDGVIIRKEKYKDGKGLWVMSKDGEIIYQNQEGDSIVAVNGVPEPIKLYWGVLEDDSTEQKLNVRKNTDKLFLVHTTGGENYKTLNVVLQSEVIAGASKLASEEKNATEKSITKHNTMCDTYKMQLDELALLPEDVVMELDRLKHSIVNDIKEQNILAELIRLKQISDSIAIYDTLPTLNLQAVLDLTELIKLNTTVNMAIPPKVNNINVTQLQEISELMGLRKTANIVVYDELSKVDIMQIEQIRDICMAYNSFIAIATEVDSLDKEEQEVRDTMSELCNEFEIQLCRNCGALVNSEGTHTHRNGEGKAV